MAVATYFVEIDWDRNGSYTGNDDVTGDTRGVVPLTIDYGRDIGAGVVGGILSSEATVILNNSDAKYHPANSSSVLFGDLGPGRDTRIRTSAPTARNLFRGYLFDFRVRPNPGEKEVEFVAYGGLNRIQSTVITTAVFTGITTGSAIGEVLDAAGWPGGRRALDTGGTTIPVWYVDGKSALDALEELLIAEGPGAFLFEDGDGDIVFHDRHRRLTQTLSTTSQATFRDTGTEPVFTIPHEYAPGWDRVINNVQITLKEFEVSPVKRVWFSASKNRSLAAGETLDIEVTFDEALGTLETATVSGSADPNWTPDSLTLYDILVSGAGGAGASDLSVSYSQTTGTAVTVTLENTHVSGTLNVLVIRLRGQTYEPVDGEIISATNATSVTKYGTRSLLLDDVWMDANTAQGIADVIVNDFGEPTAVMTVNVTNGHSTRLTEILTREINDRVTVVEAASGLNVEGFIERTQHEIAEAGKSHVATYEITEVGTPLVAANEVFILNDATQGKLGTGKLGY